MASINELPSVNIKSLIRENNVSAAEKIDNSIKKKDFGDTITEFIQSVNTQSKESAQMSQDVIQGKSDNLHEAMAKMEEAGLSFKLMLEIRNKLLESYKEVSRTQV